MSENEEDLGRLFGTPVEPESLDWQHVGVQMDTDRLAWVVGAKDFDLVPPGGVGRWQPIGPAPLLVRNEQLFCGPGPDAGQVRDLAIDPTPDAGPTLYMACNSAGVWKSVNGGASWRPLNDQLQSLRIGAVAIDFADPNIVYAGSGTLFDGSHGERRGAGLFKSLDGGTTWMRIDGGVEGSALARGGINRLVVPAPEVLVVATHSGLFISNEGGLNLDARNPPAQGFISELALDTSQRTVRRVRDATVATPIVLTCARHGWRDNDVIYVGGVASNRAANGRWRVHVVDDDRVELLGSAGNGVDAVSGYAVGPAHSRAIAITNATVPAANGRVEITAAAHGLLTGDVVAVHGVTGLNGADGSWSVEVLDANRVRLRGSRGTGAYAGGGAIDAADVPFELPVLGAVDDPAGAIFTVREHGFANGDRTRVSALAIATGEFANARVQVVDEDRVRLHNVHLAAVYAGGGTLRRPPAVWNTLLYSSNGFFDRDDSSNFNPSRGLFRMALTADGPVRSTNLLANAGGFTSAYNRVAFAQGGTGATRTLYAVIQHGGVPGVQTVNRLRAFLRSADLGESWTQPGNLLTVTNGWEQRQSHYDLLLAVDPRDPRRVFAGMRQLWLSEDAGDHWTTRMPATEGGWNVPSILTRALAPSLTHVHWDQHVFRHLPPTYWPPAGGPPPAPIALYAGSDGGLVRTPDGGQTFEQLNEGVATALLLSLDVGRGAGRNRVSAGGMWDNGTASATEADAAQRWTLGSNGDGGPVAVDPADPNIIFGVNNGNLVRTFNGGKTWQEQGATTIMPPVEVRNTNPVEIVMAGHPLRTGDTVLVSGVQGGGGVANGTRQVTRISDTTFSLNGVNGTGVAAFVQPQRVLGRRYRRQFAVTAATLQNPIEIETAEDHGLATGDEVNIVGVVGPSPANSTPANPWFTVTVINARRFSLNGADATLAGPYQPGTGIVRGPREPAALLPIFFVAPWRAPAGLRPIVVTALDHRFVTGEQVTITGVLGVTAANVNNHPITVLDADSFELNGLTTGQRWHLNAGVRWPAMGNGLPAGASADTFTRIAIVPNAAGPATRIFVAIGRNLYRSDNGGRSFTLVHQNFPGVVTSLLAPALDRLWVGTAQYTAGNTVRPGEVWFSRDGGVHWLTTAAHNFVLRPGGRGAVSAIAEDPHNADQVAIVYSGYSNTDPRFLARHAFLTTSRGIRVAGAHPWTEISGTSFNTAGNLPDLPVLSVAFDGTTNPSQLLVGTDLGVLRRTATGWERVGSNLPRVSCQALAVDNSVNPSVVRVATYGRSAWELERPATGSLDVTCDAGFAPTLVGTTRTQRITLHNSGGGPLQVTRLDFVTGGFALAPAPVVPLALAAGATTAFDLTFTPAAAGSVRDTIQIDSDDPNRPSQSIDVHGVGIAAGGRPRVTFTRRLRFGATLVGRTRTLTLTIENRSAVPAVITNVALFAAVPGLTVAANPARPFQLAPGARQDIDVTYTPAAVNAAGFRESVVLEVEDTAGNGVQFELIRAVGSAQSAATDLLTSLLAALGLADDPDVLVA
jgi:hypothetical protein